jgi:hypothetical protein
MRYRVRDFGVGLIATTLAGVSLATGTATASPATPPVAKKVTLTFSSDGATVLATKGELVVVKLAGHGLVWSAAQAVQTTPVLRLVSERTTTTGASTTVFRVVNYGSADLDATGTSTCTAATGCPPFVLLWHASVTVPVVDPPGPISG